MVAKTFMTTPLGEMLLAATEDGLRGAWFVDQEHYPQQRDAWKEHAAHPLLLQAATELREYFDGTRQAFDIQLAPLTTLGTPWQQRVWEAIRRIPPGMTRTYAELAQEAGSPKAVRAAGASVGRNPLSIIIPCHRVLGSDGSLRGYAGGLARKRWLLELEGIEPAR